VINKQREELRQRLSNRGEDFARKLWERSEFLKLQSDILLNLAHEKNSLCLSCLATLICEKGLERKKHEVCRALQKLPIHS
jgi:hypothetical protein